MEESPFPGMIQRQVYQSLKKKLKCQIKIYCNKESNSRSPSRRRKMNRKHMWHHLNKLLSRQPGPRYLPSYLSSWLKLKRKRKVSRGRWQGILWRIIRGIGLRLLELEWQKRITRSPRKSGNNWDQSKKIMFKMVLTHLMVPSLKVTDQMILFRSTCPTLTHQEVFI